MLAILSLILVVAQAAEPVAPTTEATPVATEPAISPPAEPTVSTEPVTAPSVEVTVTPPTTVTPVAPATKSQWPLILILIGTLGLGGGYFTFIKK